MQNSKILHDSSVYTNLQGLGSLKHEYKTNASGVTKEVSQQFESLLLQILLKSMRDTNTAFNSGLMDSEQSGMYGDLYDKQLSMVLSKSGIGLAKSIEGYLDKTIPKPVEPVSKNLNPVAESSHLKEKMFPLDLKKERTSATPFIKPDANVSATESPSTTFDTASDFVKTLWNSAKMAAQVIGVDPKILLAQAALETCWGKKILPGEDGKSTNNLFNIKADGKWQKESVQLNAVEEKDGVLIREKSKFRVYDSYHASFLDYTQFLQNNTRYNQALKNATDPHKFIHSLQEANYATDSKYADKIMSIYNSKTFNNLF